jgi:integrase
LSGVNQAQHLAKLSALFAIAISEGVLAVNPFAGIKPRVSRLETRQSTKKRAFQESELSSFLLHSKLKDETFYKIISCLLLTGARSSEICGLRVRDIREVDGCLCIDINDEARSLKNRSSNRILPVPSAVRHQFEGLARGRRNSEELLFSGLPDRAQGPAHQLQIEASALIRKHVTTDKRVTLHSLRHTWRQRAERYGVSPAVRRAILGHALGRDVHDTAYGDRAQIPELSAAIEIVANSYAHLFSHTDVADIPSSNLKKEKAVEI